MNMCIYIYNIYMFVFLKCHGLSRLQAFALPWLTSTRLWWASHLDRRGFRLCQSFFFGCHCLINLWQIRISVYMFTIVYIIVYIHYSPNSVSTLRGCYGRSKGRCLIRVLQLGRGIFPVNFRIKWLLWNVDVHFDCAGSRKVRAAVCRDPKERSCQQSAYRDLVQRSCQETSCGDLLRRELLQRACTVYRDLIKRSCQEISYRDLVREVLPTELL